ncbi:MAG: dihydroorotate dehydrogenase-like protein [Clostridia bacterium]|jgi:dihydroorotate dehydrogenase (fumarate)|nr:dihydroorotate dehydrogenase-like protein [Spirochaetia bacterium]
MADLNCTYLGLPLRNPVIMASSGLTASAEGVKRSIDAGVGAVVLKSLFEEQLRAELGQVGSIWEHPEAAAFLDGMGMNEGSAEYLALIAAARKAGDVPVFASVNCAGASAWTDFAKRIESAGADALELNLGVLPADPSEQGSAIEDRLVGIVATVSSAVRIPVAVKLGSAYTNIGNIAQRLAGAGAKGVVLFNRFYRMDIDLETLSLTAGPTRGTSEAYHESLRWIALLEGRIGAAQLCASGGVFDGLSVLKLVASGASAVQVCSAAYAKGYGALTKIIDEMGTWMDSHKLASLAELRGKLARRNSDKPELYGRLHYIKALTGQS